ncbi:hypothetical protein Tco_0638036 [Tanacetum coccineum]
MIRQYIVCKRLCFRVWDMHGAILMKSQSTLSSSPPLSILVIQNIMMDVAFYLMVEIDESDGFGFGSDMSMKSWNFGRDILCDIHGHNFPHEEFRIDFCGESFELLYKNGVIDIDVASNSRNNGFWVGFDMRILREIEFQKDLVLEDFESFIRSFLKEDSSGRKKYLVSDRSKLR